MSFLSARAKVGLSQMAVAKEMGVTDAAVSMWETGKTSPRATLLVKLAELYRCSVDELLSDNPTQKNLEHNQGMCREVNA